MNFIERDVVQQELDSKNPDIKAIDLYYYQFVILEFYSEAHATGYFE